MKICSVLDVKSGFFLKPFADSSTANAIRSFDVAVNESKTAFNSHPDDFALMELGEFDSQTGCIKPHSHPLNLCTARSLLKQPATQATLPGMSNG